MQAFRGIIFSTSKNSEPIGKKRVGEERRGAEATERRRREGITEHEAVMSKV